MDRKINKFCTSSFSKEEKRRLFFPIKPRLCHTCQKPKAKKHIDFDNLSNYHQRLICMCVLARHPAGHNDDEEHGGEDNDHLEEHGGEDNDYFEEHGGDDNDYLEEHGGDDNAALEDHGVGPRGGRGVGRGVGPHGGHDGGHGGGHDGGHGGDGNNFVTIAQFTAFQNQITNSINQINTNINNILNRLNNNNIN